MDFYNLQQASTVKLLQKKRKFCHINAEIMQDGAWEREKNFDFSTVFFYSFFVFTNASLLFLRFKYITFDKK